MNSTDISRLLLQPEKHYSGVRLQQGRVVTDADINELSAISDDDNWRVLRDLIGPSGSPDKGFSVALSLGDVVIPQSVSFNGEDVVSVLPYRLNDGVMYVCGVRFIHSQTDLEGVTGGDVVAMQQDYLQMQASQAPLARPGETHAQIAWLHAWEQCVTSIEDHEFHEYALGQIDTSTRVRRMCNVHVEEVEPGLDCVEAWSLVRERIEADTGGTFDTGGSCLLSSARLQITYDTGAALDACAACSPEEAGRYLGADNQAIRIMMVSQTEYVWSTDNASPVYRVHVDIPADGQVNVRMLSLPRDEAHWPLRNTVAEFLPWGAVLPNGQKIASEPGVFIRIDTGFNPDTGSFEIGEMDSTALDGLTRQWDDAHPKRAQLPNDADPDGNFLYMRLWHRIDSDTDPVLLPVAGPHDLISRLGIQPVFSGIANAGDFWTMAVRPDTPRSIVPWNLTMDGGVEPHGPRHLYAPLSLITFRPPQAGEPENAEVVESIEDCRLRFRPLTGQSGCCTHTVGDGVTSYGDYQSIQVAVDQLPVEGGRVCVLPGNYSEETIVDSDNVVIEGCGTDTMISAPSGEPGGAVFQINGSNITLRHLTISTSAQIGVRVNSENAEGEIASSNVKLDALRVIAEQRSGDNGQARTGLDVRRARQVSICDCFVSMDGSLSDDCAVFVRGEHIQISGCHIESLPPSGTSSAWSGIQVGGDSHHVNIIRNELSGGLGHGITLGSLFWDSQTSTRTESFGTGTGLIDIQDPCAPTFRGVSPVEVEDIRYDPRSAGDLSDVRISDNHLEGFSGNGISVLTLMPLTEDGGNELITTDRISIDLNRIINNIDQSESLASNSPVSKVKKLEAGDDQEFGKFVISEIPPAGIVLVDGEHMSIRDNIIQDNGNANPVPVSGICIIYGNGIVIEGNRIQNNGLREPGSMPIGDMSRAGIVVSLAGIASNQPDQSQSDSLGSSLRVVSNTVEHPNGPALVVRATGPVMIEANQLESLGSNATSHQPGIAHCVSIDNLGRPYESVDLAPGEPSENRWLMPQGTEDYLQRDTDPDSAEQRIGEGGRVLFANNHVSLQWVEASGVSSGLAGGFAVGICSLDDVTCTANQFSLNVEDPGVKKSGGSLLNRQPRISAHVVLVGATANASHNRVAEGVNDALISLLVLGGFLVSSTHNISTHASFASTCNTYTANSSDPPSELPSERVDRNNLVWLTPSVEASGVDLVSVNTVNSTANQLFASLCASCLGIGEEGFSQFSLFTILATGAIVDD